MFGIIGGTGLYKLEKVALLEKQRISTPFGEPSGPISQFEANGQKFFFLPRHGENHEFLPSEINFRANIYALKKIGVRTVVSISAVGSLVEHLSPGTLALPVQFIDFTKRRVASFFGNGLVGHISSAEPSCPTLRQVLLEVVHRKDIPIREVGPYVCVEGPRLGTRGESEMFRKIGGELIGMTACPEVFLAQEAQLSYVTLAVVTDYDCWRDNPSEHASVEAIMKQYAKSLEAVQQCVIAIVSKDSLVPDANRRRCLKGAIATPSERMTPEQREMLSVLQE